MISTTAAKVMDRKGGGRKAEGEKKHQLEGEEEDIRGGGTREMN